MGAKKTGSVLPRSLVITRTFIHPQMLLGAQRLLSHRSFSSGLGEGISALPLHSWLKFVGAKGTPAVCNGLMVK